MKATLVVSSYTDNNYLYNACQQLHDVLVEDITVLYCYTNSYSAVNCNASRVIYAELTDMYSYSAVEQVINSSNINSDIMVFSPEMFGQHMCAMYATTNNLNPLLDCTIVGVSGSSVTANKGAYNMNLTATRTLQLPIAVTLSQLPKPSNIVEYNIDATHISCDTTRAYYDNVEFVASVKVESIARAPKVIALGKGVGSTANYEKYRHIATTLGYSLGGTRPVALDGHVPLDNMIGVSSKFLSADSVLVFGASGAKPFAVGLENCKTVIAVNNDEDSLIFGQCDIGIVADCNKVAEAIVELLEQDS